MKKVSEKYKDAHILEIYLEDMQRLKIKPMAIIYKLMLDRYAEDKNQEKFKSTMEDLKKDHPDFELKDADKQSFLSKGMIY